MDIQAMIEALNQLLKQDNDICNRMGCYGLNCNQCLGHKPTVVRMRDALLAKTDANTKDN